MKKLIILLLFIPILATAQRELPLNYSIDVKGNTRTDTLKVNRARFSDGSIQNTAYKTDSIRKYINDTTQNYLLKSSAVNLYHPKGGNISNDFLADSSYFNRLVVNNRTMTVGNESLRSVGVGLKSLYSQTGGSDNTAFGWETMYNKTGGSYNTAIGRHAMFGNIIGNGNTALGSDAMGFCLGDYNTAVGYDALHSPQNFGCTATTAIGKSAGHSGSNLNYAAIVGYHAAYGDTINLTSEYDVFVGAYAGGFSYKGGTGRNTIIGGRAGHDLVTGNNNIIIGYNSGGIGSGTGNILIGNNLNATTTTTNNQIKIGSNISGDASTGALNVGSFVSTTISSATPFNLRTSDWVASSTGSQLSVGFSASTGNVDTRMQSFRAGGNSNGNLILQYIGGNVGIRTSTTDSILTISGGISARGIRLTGNIIVSGKITQTQLTAALTDDTPTDSEIDAATGLTPATAGAGYQVTIKDNNGSGLLYKVESDGTNWYYVKMSQAL